MIENSRLKDTYSPHNKWSVLTRMFHWVSLVLLIVTWLMIVLYENTEGSNYINFHKSFGVSLLFWTLARLIHRLFIKSPQPLTIPLWQKALAHLTHIVLYLLLLSMPTVGILMSWYGGHSISVFGLFNIPPLIEPNRALSRYFNNLHTEIIWPTLLGFTALHVLGALYHQFVKKDGLISRMR